MDLIDYIDFVLSLIGLKSCSFDEFADIVDSGIARCIDLDHIEHSATIERLTVRTLVARVPISETRTVHGFCEDTCARRLPGSTRSMEKIGMTRAS